MPLQPDYLGHDTEYRRRRAQGRNGWSDEIGLRQAIASIDSFLADLSLPAAPTLIEFGCGAGDLSLHLAARGFHITGFDIAPFAIEWAREKASRQSVTGSFLIADLTCDLDPLPPPADVVLDGLCLHCIIGPDRETFFRNVWRCLKPNGVFLVNTMCGNPHPPNDRDFDPISRCIVTRGIARRYFGTAESIVQEVIQAGFRVDRHQVIHAQYPGDEDALLINACLRA
jgi:2-polyprenyl-3-methyl-5-hydroxy-6-metoxy-1,4-benzoquinol methylase